MVQRRSQSDHDSLLSALARHLATNGFTNIKVDLSGHDQPGKIWWSGKEQEAHIPDATAYKGGTYYIFEVETDDTIAITHTEDQWRLFAAHAKKNNGKFVAIVPAESKQAAERQIGRLGINAEVWT
jgi:Holliday junction resolvase